MKYTFMLISLLFLSGYLLQAQVGSQEVLLQEIEEVSGICYDSEYNLLFACTDEGVVFKCSTDGAIIKESYLGDYDFEGIEVFAGFIFTVAEDENLIVKINPVTLNIENHWQLPETLFGHDDGVEGITFVDDHVYLCVQSDVVYSGEQDVNVVSRIVRLSGVDSGLPVIETMITIPFPDLSGLAFWSGYLYIVSDDNDELYKVNFETADIEEIYGLPGDDQEGVAFDSEGFLYIALDSRGIVKIDFNQSRR